MNMKPLILLLLFYSGLTLDAQALEFPQNGNNWDSFAQIPETLARRGTGEILLKELSEDHTKDGQNDLILNFDSSNLVDLAHKYTLQGDTRFKPAPSRSAVRGEGSAAFQNRDDGLVFKGSPDSLFAPGTLWQDFSLGFWLYPATLQDGETIFLWKGAQGRNFEAQEFRVTLQGRKVQWKMDRFFKDSPRGTVVLTGLKSLLPRTWHHHRLNFDSSTGLLEYLVDGIPEASVYMTASARDGSQVYFPLIGSASQNLVYLGPNLTALVDDLSLTGSRLEPSLHRYPSQGADLDSQILDLGTPGAFFTKIETSQLTPGRTALQFQYRIADQKNYRWEFKDGTTTTTLAGSDQWQDIIPGQELAGTPRGRFLQIKVRFLPDGTGAVSPVLKTLKVYFRKNPPPSPPQGVFVKSVEENSVTLEWQPVTREGIKGYKVFYGTSPRSFSFSREMTPNTSHTIDNLIQGQIYYFTVVTVDDSHTGPGTGGSGGQMSVPSPEVWARPGMGMESSGSR